MFNEFKVVLNSLNFAQGIGRLPMHISRRDFFLKSRYVINEVKFHYLAQTKMVLRHLLFGCFFPILSVFSFSKSNCFAYHRPVITPPYFPITLPQLWGSGVVRVKTFAFRSCPGQLMLARIHFGYQNAVALFLYWNARFSENEERVTHSKISNENLNHLKNQPLPKTWVHWWINIDKS